MIVNEMFKVYIRNSLNASKYLIFDSMMEYFDC